VTVSGVALGLLGSIADPHGLLVGACLALAVLVARPAATTRCRLARGAGTGSPGVVGGREHPVGAVSGARPPRRRRPEAADGVPVPVLLDMVAEVLSGGAPVTRAVSAVGEALRAIGDPAAAEVLALAARLATGAPVVRPAVRSRRGLGTGGRRVSGSPGSFAVVRLLGEALDLALATGSSPVGLIRAAAQEERRARAARSVQSARRLGVLVLLPTGLCLLPAFLLLTVVPLAIDLALG
jgi:hypothetical protein